MSIVGTRPPLIGEVSEYELHHRARLAIKPGITGMWQVSGRSDITDFEEVVVIRLQVIRLGWQDGWNFGFWMFALQTRRRWNSFTTTTAKRICWMTVEELMPR